MEVNVSLVPLIAVLAYIPLLLATIHSKPWNSRKTLFLLFLLSAFFWSLSNFVFRADFIDNHSNTAFKVVISLYVTMAILFHHFCSTYYPSGTRKWLPFAYISLVLLIAFVFLGEVTNITATDGIMHGSYTLQVIPLAIVLSILAARNYYIFINLLRDNKKPENHNQYLMLIIGLSGLLAVSYTHLTLPTKRIV